MPDTLKPLCDSAASVLDSVCADAEQIRALVAKNPSGTSTIITELVRSIQNKIGEIKSTLPEFARAEADHTELLTSVEQQRAQVKEKIKLLRQERINQKHARLEYAQILKKSRIHRRLFETVAKNSTNGIAVLDGGDLRVLWTNTAMLSLLDEPFRTDGILGCSIDEFIPLACDIGLADICRQVAETGQTRSDVDICYTGFKRGVTYWRRTISPLTIDDHSEIVLQLTDMTDQYNERKRIEALAAEHHQQRTMLDLIMESAPVGIAFIDRQYRYIMVNKAMAQVNGVAASDHIGKTIYEVIPQLASQIASLTEPVIQKGQSIIDFEYQWTDPGFPENIRYALVSFFPVFAPDNGIDGIGVIVNEITNRKNAENQLRSSQEQLLLFLKHTPAAIAMFDTEMRYMLYTRRWITDYSLQNTNITGMTHYEVFPEIPQRWKEDHKNCLQGIPVRSDLDSFIRPDGSTEWLKYELYPWYQPNGKVGGIIMFTEVITKQKQAQDQLNESRARLSALIESLPFDFWNCGTDGRYQMLNSACKRHWGDMTGLHPSETSMEEEVKKIWIANNTRALTGEILTGEVHYTILGRDVAFYNILAPVRVDGRITGIVGVNIDITETKELEDQLRRSESRFRALVETTSDWIWEVDSKSKYTYVSPKVKDLLGYEPHEIIGKTPFDLMTPDSAEKAVQIFAVLSAQKQSLNSFENINLHKNGSEVVLESSGVPIIDDGENLLGYRGIDRDITERKRIQQKLEDYKDELQQKNAELESILGVASHDLRSPLVNIKGFSNEIAGTVELIKDCLNHCEMKKECKRRLLTIAETDLPESLGYIQSSASTIEQVLNGLLRVARVGLASLTLRHIDMNAVVAVIAKNVEFSLKQAGASIQLESLPPCTADESQVIQIFTNLIDNAIKYFDPSRPGKISIHGTTDKDFSLYLIEDNGLGIPYKYQEKIFELFYRINPREAKGEGLGLTMVRRMVDRNNGRIWVDSEPGKGSRFYVLLPK